LMLMWIQKHYTVLEEIVSSTEKKNEFRVKKICKIC
jgi:hypothetical protein